MSRYNRTELFETIPIKKSVLIQILPAIASQMIALIYNLSDTYFVGRLNDPRQTAAITVAASSFLMLTAISNLFGIGGASLVTRKLGSGQTEEARQTSSICFWMALFSGLCFSILFALLAHPILRISGATEAVYAFAFSYTKWVIILGGLPTILNTMLSNLIRAEGSAFIASFGVSMGGILNILLDPFFVLPEFLGLGAVGAGIATALSNTCSAVFFLIYIPVKSDTVLNLHIRYLIYWKNHLWDILKIGIPSAIQYGLTVVAVAAQTRFVSQYSPQAVAALGITKKLDQLPLYFSIGVANGILPLIGYNHANGNPARRETAFRFGCMISVSFSVLCLIIYESFAPFLVRLFIADSLTVAYGSVFVRCMVTAMPFMALCYPMIIRFQAMGKAKEALIISILRKGVLDIPFLFLFDFLSPLYGCMLVQPVVDFLSLLAAVFLYRRDSRRTPPL
ncbi:MAG: MATE family efflux transporter [Bacteroides sp.]|nr:MATE family efflux transporter [Bacteroides sp.]MCM1548893.1 MATE family efflux transporter [Clostridium sp.]